MNRKVAYPVVASLCCLVIGLSIALGVIVSNNRNENDWVEVWRVEYSVGSNVNTHTSSWEINHVREMVDFSEFTPLSTPLRGSLNRDGRGYPALYSGDIIGHTGNFHTADGHFTYRLIFNSIEKQKVRIQVSGDIVRIMIGNIISRVQSQSINILYFAS